MIRKKKFDYLVFICRVQPLHKGHMTVIDKALELSEKLIIVLGTHNSPRNPRNIWKSHERIEMIKSVYGDVSDRIEFAVQEDYMYVDDKWVASVQGQVNHIVHRKWKPGPTKIGLIGHSKDHTSFYLKMFPNWESVDVKQEIDFDATTAREIMFEKNTIPNEVPLPVQQWIENWTKTNKNELEQLLEEYQYIKDYKKSWESAPFPPIFVTVDSVVVQSGHILLVERGGFPGKGLLALPGGFINQNETLKDAMIRELREETRLKVPAPVLKGSIADYEVFDAPNRSLRGRTITHAFYIRLTDMTELPKVKGNDDARRAMWIPLSDVKRENMMEDHWDIIDKMVGL